jgi:protein-S-isoprenylcysteine O-methyltransferase Ste14
MKFVRYGLIAVAVGQASTGLWALFAPHSFYGDFPAGRGGWVSATGPYNEHMTVDYGALSMALVAVLIAAAVVLERRMVLAAAGAYLVWSVPHFIYHAFTLGIYGTGDAIGNMVTLGATVALPVAIIVVARRMPAERVA